VTTLWRGGFFKLGRERTPQGVFVWEGGGAQSTRGRGAPVGRK